MSCDRESWILSLEEIAAIVSLVGRQQFVGLAETQPEQLQPQELLNACCALVRDGLMTQVNGRYRLARAFSEVMEPVCLARMVLALIPGQGRRERRMFYVGRSVTEMERSIRGFVLTRLEAEEVADVLWEHMELCPEEETMETVPVCPDASAERELLLRDASFLLEVLDPLNGSRRGWLRVRRQALRDSWLEWTQEGGVRQTPLSRRALYEAIGNMLRGETV